MGNLRSSLRNKKTGSRDLGSPASGTISRGDNHWVDLDPGSQVNAGRVPKEVREHSDSDSPDLEGIWRLSPLVDELEHLEPPQEGPQRLKSHGNRPPRQHVPCASFINHTVTQKGPPLKNKTLVSLSVATSGLWRGLNFQFHQRISPRPKVSLALTPRNKEHNLITALVEPVGRSMEGGDSLAPLSGPSNERTCTLPPTHLLVESF